MQDDERHMRHALSLAERGLGTCWPNPSVGAVLVKDGVIVGRGWTARGGRPHAETIAIAQAGEHARGATLYVTLEPCSHTGKTGPCTDAILAAGISRVVLACTDPNPKVAGEGIRYLKLLGLDVLQGVCEPQALAQNAGFFKQITQGIPLVALKIATTLDGKIATQTGESKWITGDAARNRAHLLRAQHDAVLTGIGTVLADDPMLTCRLPGLENDSPVRVILDSDLALPPTSHIAKTAKEIPTWVMTGNSDSPAANALTSQGLKLFTCRMNEGKIDLRHALEILGAQGITRLLVEAGGKLSGAFFAGNLVDTLYWFRAPFMIGKDGMNAIDAALAETLASLTYYKRISTTALGDDLLEIYKA